MIARVIIEDGVVQVVQLDAEAVAAGVFVEIVDFDRDNGNKDELEKYYKDESVVETGSYSIDHCETDDKDND